MFERDIAAICLAFSYFSPQLSLQLHGPGEVQDDFLIDSFTIPGFIALYGIESPGLTSSLAIGEHIASLIKPSSRL